MSLRSVALLAFFAGSLPVCFVRPFYGILLWIMIAFLNPQSYLWGDAATYRWAMAVAIPTILGVFVFSRNWIRRFGSGIVLLLAIFWIWITVTSIVSTHTPLFMHHAAETWERWGFICKVLLMTFLAIVIVDSFERLRMLVLVTAGCFGVFVAKSFPFVILTRGQFRLYGPENSMIADNNDFGLALNMTLPLFFFLAQTEFHPWVKRAFGFLFVITIPAIFFTYSRGALLALIVVGFLMFLQLKRRLLLVPVIIMGALVAVMFAPESWQQRMDPTRKDQVDDSARGRLNAWSFARNLAAEYPITGGGFLTFTGELFTRYAPNNAPFRGPHSIYFQVLGEHGYVGLGLYLTLIATAYASAGKVARQARARNDRFMLNYVNMFRFSLLAFLVNGVFLGRAYFDYFFTIVACLAVLPQVVHQEWEREDEEDEEEEQEEEEAAIGLDEHELLPQPGTPLWRT
jgi:putative inorganic carbon (hco3(-)) transporter